MTIPQSKTPMLSQMEKIPIAAQDSVNSFNNLPIAEVYNDTQKLKGDLLPAPEAAATYGSLPLKGNNVTRILKILPPELQDEQTIACQLWTITLDPYISLDHAPFQEYRAISYVWGPPSETRRILVNNKPFVVRKNIWSFLDHMKKQNTLGPFWIDAICINQACVPERNHQVSVMGKIYKKATKVIVWLGLESSIFPFDHGTLPLAPFGPRLAKIGKSMSELERRFQAPSLLESIQLLSESLTTPRTILGNNQFAAERRETIALLLKKMTQLFGVEYWTRMWVAQEYILARAITLMTDQSQVDGDSFIAACRTALATIESLPPRRILALSSETPGRDLNGDGNLRSSLVRMETSVAMTMIKRREGLYSTYGFQYLQTLVTAFADSQCFDPRDHIYAVLSLTDPLDLLDYNLAPDYSKSRLQLYIEIACVIIKRGHGVDWRHSSMVEFARVLGIDGDTFNKVRIYVNRDINHGKQLSAADMYKEMLRADPSLEVE